MGIIRGKVKDIVFKHDASRIVQTAVKYGGQKERNEIAEELKGKYKELAQNKYSRVRRRTVCDCENTLITVGFTVSRNKTDSSVPFPSGLDTHGISRLDITAPLTQRGFYCPCGRFRTVRKCIRTLASHEGLLWQGGYSRLDNCW